MVELIKGNIFETNCDIIIHGCNCRGGFGYGLAEQIKTKFPLAEKAYFNKFNSVGWNLGDIQIVDCGNKKIINAATQYDYGSPKSGKVFIDYDAIRKCLELTKKYAKGFGLSIASPKIGSSLGGGDWKKIEKIMQEVFTDYNIKVYYLK